MNAIKRIAIVGIGGVGGFIGAKLLLSSNALPVQVTFFARNDAYKNIRKQGLIFESGGKMDMVHPQHLYNRSKGAYDVVIIATKSYSLELATKAYADIMDKQTLVVPLQNMVNAAELVKGVAPEANVLDACIYLISNLIKPGHVKHLGGPGKIITSIPEGSNHKWFYEYMNQAGIPMEGRADALHQIWKKYLFISTLGTITAAHDLSFGEVIKDPKMTQIWIQLMEELALLAQSEGFALGAADIDHFLGFIRDFHVASKSSFQLDIDIGSKGEKEFLVDFVIQRSLERGLEPLTYIDLDNLINRRLGIDV
ncbi:ketopantoate reductase family protein [Cyclobacterium plantarum]|uniref:ketopantoate reductase family protein n=1 Tax=Cyclobacterium plantarum TaxID=2716263 RepID=UPI003F6F3290